MGISWLKWTWTEWVLIGLTTVGVISMLPVTRGWPLAIQDAGFLALVLVLLWCPGLGWWRFARLRRAGGWSSWRVWATLGACVALSAAVAVPFLAILSFGRFRWDFLSAGYITAAAALILGCLAKWPARFPLMLGGFGMVSFMVLIPKGML
jgi:hypothetical protein